MFLVSGRDILGTLLELFSWIGIPLGITFLLVALLVRGVSGRWEETTAVIVRESAPLEARWMAHDGSIHSRVLEDHELEHAADEDALTIYMNPSRPERMRLRRHGGGEQTLWVLTAIFGGVGVLASVAGLIVMFIPE
ncbi:hypothetical protein DF220_01335 [Salinibacterium hongtaonis]|uniref:DUF3592 domain-containing protein n=1 Tax=Homoserinimonas hongtaonis TaxID=2079791 RepID=A0A2U1SYC6_9MICO|nr:hypothetical protein C2138_06175 [Salinibacterium hongtaonis]PWB96627.1 hypothetical protein DF220_01335 [Salinibacterium hongtaonis]